MNKVKTFMLQIDIVNHKLLIASGGVDTDQGRSNDAGNNYIGSPVQQASDTLIVNFEEGMRLY